MLFYRGVRLLQNLGIVEVSILLEDFQIGTGKFIIAIISHFLTCQLKLYMTYDVRIFILLHLALSRWWYVALLITNYHLWVKGISCLLVVATVAAATLVKLGEDICVSSLVVNWFYLGTWWRSLILLELWASEVCLFRLRKRSVFHFYYWCCYYFPYIHVIFSSCTCSWCVCVCVVVVALLWMMHRFAFFGLAWHISW